MPINDKLQDFLNLCQKSGMLDEIQKEIVSMKKVESEADAHEVDVYSDSIREHIKKVEALIMTRPRAKPTWEAVKQTILSDFGASQAVQGVVEDPEAVESILKRSEGVERPNQPILNEPLTGVHHKNPVGTRRNSRFVRNAAGDLVDSVDIDVIKGGKEVKNFGKPTPF